MVLMRGKLSVFVPPRFCRQEDRLAHVNRPTFVRHESKVAEQHWENHLTATLPRRSAETTLETRQYLHGALEILAPTMCGCGRLRLNIRRRFLSGFTFLPLTVESAHSIQQLAQYTVHCRIHLRGVRVHVIARVVSVDERCQRIGVRGFL